jgi:acetyltransferase-like isoleucine patch superfamily enzyme
VSFGTHSNTGHDTCIGDYAQVSGSCEINGNAQLEEGVFLGSHATILPNAHVGAWAFVGAGSVVLRRVAPGAKVFGNPAVAIGSA